MIAYTMADRQDLGAARAPRTLKVFREHEADWMLMRTLGYMNVNGAEGPLVKKVPGYLLKWALPRKLGRKPLIRAYMEYGLWAIASPEKAMRVFTLERDGTHDHCMLDNHSRMQQVIFEWLGGVFAHDDRGADADAHSRRASRTRNASSKNSIARSV